MRLPENSNVEIMSVNQPKWPLVYNWLKNTQNLFFPAHCRLCGEKTGGDQLLCIGCRNELSWLADACPVCALPGTNSLICGRCQTHPPPFSSVVAPFLYQNPLAWCVHQLKYHGKLEFAAMLGANMATKLMDNLKAFPDLIIPVPLHPSRLQERGFNQALELARPIAKKLDIPLSCRSLARYIATDAQAGLPLKERTRNVKGAFRILRPIQAKHVAIVDDVMTTGSTVIELTKTLKKEGVERVDVWVCARAVL